MRRLAALLLSLSCALPVASQAQNAPNAQGAQNAQAAPNLPPHAWLFGTWTGGFFPVPSNISAEACLAQPVVIFTRDVVLRAVLIQPTLLQREIETVRATPQGAEFRFTSAAPISSPLLGIGATAAAGFGCASPDGLTVQRRGENEILFPGCADFPNPLVRCPGH